MQNCVNEVLLLHKVCYMVFLSRAKRNAKMKAREQDIILVLSFHLQMKQGLLLWTFLWSLWIFLSFISRLACRTKPSSAAFTMRSQGRLLQIYCMYFFLCLYVIVSVNLNFVISKMRTECLSYCSYPTVVGQCISTSYLAVC